MPDNGIHLTGAATANDLKNPSPSDPSEAADANFVTHAGWLQRLHPAMTVIDDPALLLIDSGLPCDTFNFVCRARLASSDVPERARWALNYFRQARRPFSWWVGPTDLPTVLGRQPRS